PASGDRGPSRRSEGGYRHQPDPDADWLSTLFPEAAPPDARFRRRAEAARPMRQPERTSARASLLAAQGWTRFRDPPLPRRAHALSATPRVAGDRSRDP